MAANRREFLKTAVGTSTLLALSPTVPAFLAQTAAAAAPQRGQRETVLVVLQLAGGNDGLNTVVPYQDDAYAKARPTLRLPPSKLHKIDGHFGFHPQMLAFLRLFQEGRLCVLQGVGYPNPHQGHFESMRVWQTADLPPSECQTGWVGRTLDHLGDGGQADTPAVFLGHIRRPFALNGQRAIIPAISSPEQYSLQAGRGPGGDSARKELIGQAETPRSGGENSLLRFVQRRTLAAYSVSRQLETIAEARTTAEYPHFQLAEQLRTIAELVRADLGIRIFFTELGGEEPGGFDTHAGQALNHGALLEQLSRLIAAFCDDLNRDKLLDRVLLLTFSEFGRTVLENGRKGTDHGSAQPLFLAGGKVKGGLIGRHPNLTDLENGGQKFHTDFRRVYATVLDHWLGFDSQPVLGKRFEPLGVLG